MSPLCRRPESIRRRQTCKQVSVIECRSSLWDNVQDTAGTQKREKQITDSRDDLAGSETRTACLGT